jgi:alkylation response protein AidB-like acyl-CoA dehydrogenase
VELTGPTIIAFGTDAQKERFLPGIAEGRDVWCQGYSEPNAGSDLGNLSTKARLENGKWIINGQKIWTSLAHVSDWIFVVCRTEEGSKGPKGLSFLLVPMNQKGINVRPIRQMTGDAEFNEVFFDEAETDAENIVGAPGDGWKVAMGLLAFERGVSTLGQQMLFSRELQEIIEIAKHNGAAKDPMIRQKIADAHAGLKVMRYNALRMLSEPQAETLSRAALTYKLYWSSWHRDLGDLALDVMGPEGEIGDLNGRLSELTIMHLMSRSDTIYGGSNEIQRNIIAERGLGLPREPRGMRK